MEQNQITNSLDWQAMRSKLSKSKTNLGIFSRDIDKLLKSIDHEVTILGKLEVTVRNTKTRSSYENAQNQLDKINQMIKNFNKFYMMALMTHC